MKKLAGSVAVVTGAAQGIGKAIVFSLAKRGVQVICLDKQEQANATVAAQATALGTDCYAYYCDVSNSTQVSYVFDLILRKHCKIDILVNNAAVFSTVSFVEDSYHKALKDFSFNMNSNARSTFLCAKKVAPHMAQRKKGHIINVITNHVKRDLFPPSSNEHSYDASKYAQLALNESLDCELKQYGILVNAICPASTRSPMLQSFFDSVGLELTKENIGICTGHASLLECEEVGEATCAILEWDNTQPTGKAFLLMDSADCEHLKNGFMEELAQ